MMPNRRDFIFQSIAAGGAVALGTSGLTLGDESSSQAARQLRILVLGGTGFIGPHFVQAALVRGHRVSEFSRGKRPTELPPAVERLVGDRNGDLEAIKSRDWDAVVDTATFGPAWVRSIGEALKGRVKNYTFISSNGVYDDPGIDRLITEESPLKKYTWDEDPYTVTTHKAPDQYAALKVLCEWEAEQQFPGKTLILRPTLIFGPGGFALSYFWMDRITHGGQMLAAGKPSDPIQLIDVRDMAEWVIRMIEKEGTGTFNVLGPAKPIDRGRMLEVMGRVVKKKPQITWVSSAWLAERNDGNVWTNQIFWDTKLTPLMRQSAQRAIEQGLTFRPIQATLADSYHWHRKQPAESQARVFMGAKQANGAVMTWPVYLERERQVLASRQAEQSK